MNKNRLGQHFLRDGGVLDKIIKLAGIESEEVVYEVGSGRGDLTERLCKVSKFVYSSEIDPELYCYCKEKLHFDNLELLNIDGLHAGLSINFDLFISNLPYYESKNALVWLCQKRFRKGLLLVQKEFAEKLMSMPGKKSYRSISVISQYRFFMTALLTVPCYLFDPPPQVDSVLIEIIPRCPPMSKKTIDDIQFLLSFRKKNISFVLKYYDKSINDKLCDNGLEIAKIKDMKLGQLTARQIYQLSCFLNKNRTSIHM
ncbi:MAG: rRNA adenine N(6)-methyltransferase family protein [Thermoproteota archaeon]|nr:rRNA adenine N(6)-methyltransferase family protein [Thermoproteota archaeon]